MSHQVCYYLSSQSLSEVDATRPQTRHKWQVYLKPFVIHHKDVSKLEMKPCKHKYINSSWIKEFTYKWACISAYTHRHKYMWTNQIITRFHLFVFVISTHYKWLKLLNLQLYRIYWPGYPSKHLYVKSKGHDMHDKIATITGATLNLNSNSAVKQTDYYSSSKHW